MRKDRIENGIRRKVLLNAGGLFEALGLELTEEQRAAVEHMKAYDERRKASNKAHWEKHRAKRQAWREAHREEKNAAQRAYRAARREELKEKDREYHRKYYAAKKAAQATPAKPEIRDEGHAIGNCIAAKYPKKGENG